jgi:hypothetical protein
LRIGAVPRRKAADRQPPDAGPGKADRVAPPPLLILHAPTDTTVSIDHATRIYAAARHPKSFLSLEKADHLLTRKEDSARAAGLIAAWADAYVEPEPGKEPPVDVEAVETGKGKFQLRLSSGKHQLIADEPASFGGLDSGPSPFQLLGFGARLMHDDDGPALCGPEGLAAQANPGGTSAIRREPDQSPRDRFDVRHHVRRRSRSRAARRAWSRLRESARSTVR